MPSWLARWFGIHAKPEEGTAWSLQSHWAWPAWITLLFVVFAVALVVAIYLREGRQATRVYRLVLAGVRLLLLGVVLLMIAQLTLSLTPTGLPYVVVLVDDSQSMDLQRMTSADHYDDKVREALAERIKRAKLAGSDLNRWNLVRTLLSEGDGALLATLADRYKLRVFFLTDVTPAKGADAAELCDEICTHEPAGQTTALGTAVRTVLDKLRGTDPAAIILLSDGINTTGPPLADAALAQRKRVPLFCIGMGSEKPLRNLELSDLEVEDVVTVNNIVRFECKVTGTGFAGTKVRVVLREKDKPGVLVKDEVTVGPDGVAKQVNLFYEPTQPGVFHYVVEVAPQEGEVRTKDNRQEHVVRVEEEKKKIRVLLAQAYPSYEFRFLKKMLEDDKTIELKTVLQEADPVQEEGGAERRKWPDRVFPVSRAELLSYDVLILGDLNPALLSTVTLQNIADFVDRPKQGGALVLIAGPKYMPLAYRDSPLARLMPIKNWGSVRCPAEGQVLKEGFQVQPSELGLLSPPLQLGNTPLQTRTIWQDLPPLYWLLEVPDLKPGVRVLAGHPTRRGRDGQPLPVVCLQYVGAGKVLLHATDETYRWRWRVGDAYLARYWVQMIRYLCRSRPVEKGAVAALSTDRTDDPQGVALYQQGELVRLQVKFADERMAPAEENSVKVVLQPQGRQSREVLLPRTTAGRGTFEAVLTKLPVGTYHAWISSPSTAGGARPVDFEIEPLSGEFERLQMDAAALRAAADKTGGRYYSFDDARRLLKDLPPGHQVPLESPELRPIWNSWPVLLLLLVLLVGEWVFRKIGGMV